MPQQTMPRVYADFQNADASGRVRLNTVGTVNDLARQQIVLRDGLVLSLYADDLDEGGNFDELCAVGVVTFAQDEKCWVATVDWDAVGHASDTGRDANAPPRAAG